MAIGYTIDCINRNVWHSHFHMDEQIAKYRQALEGCVVCYDGDIVGIVDAAGNLVVVYRYDKRGVYSMQMNDIMKSLCEESAYVSVYGDPMEVAKFKFGKFLCVGDFRTVMLLVSPNGDYDGIVVNNTEDVFRVDSCGHYHEKMGKLINFCIDSVELPCIDKACIDLSILSFAKERKKIVSIELHDSGFADVVGFVDEVDEKVCRIHVIDEYGYDDSCSYVDLNSISQIVLDSEDERRIARLYQANLKL